MLPFKMDMKSRIDEELGEGINFFTKWREAVTAHLKKKR